MSFQAVTCTGTDNYKKVKKIKQTTLRSSEMGSLIKSYIRTFNTNPVAHL